MQHGTLRRRHFIPFRYEGWQEMLRWLDSVVESGVTHLLATGAKKRIQDSVTSIHHQEKAYGIES